MLGFWYKIFFWCNADMLEISIPRSLNLYFKRFSHLQVLLKVASSSERRRYLYNLYSYKFLSFSLLVSQLYRLTPQCWETAKFSLRLMLLHAWFAVAFIMLKFVVNDIWNLNVCQEKNNQLLVRIYNFYQSK